jgi:hypothetical protein
MAASILLIMAPPCMAELSIYGLPAGDLNYAWNSKYGPYGYTQGGTDIGVGLYFGAPYGNDYTMGILEIAITDLQSSAPTAVELKVYSNGFGTGYFYGSAGLRWLDPGSTPVTGDPAADGLGPLLGGPSVEYELWNSDYGQPAGWYSFDVTAHVLADLTAGRDFTTFVLNGSRDTGGSIRTAEFGSGFGPQLAATVPEPRIWALLAGAAGFFLLRRHRKD